MNKMILKAKNREELDQMIKKSITLLEDETIKIKVIKEPKKFLFLNFEGTYEVEILKKSELKNEIKVEKNRKVVENKQEKNVNSKNFESKDKKQISKKPKKDKKDFEIKEKNIIKQEKKEQVVEKENNEDANYGKIRSFIKEFIVKSKLNIKIVKIEKINERYVVNLDGKDMRYLIGEKGSTLNSLEYLLISIKNFKNIKITIDSNNYKDSREKSLRELARKKGKKVLETNKYIKLNPMSARERKIIHEEISYMKGLKTESQGEEPKRYLVIKPL